MGLYDKLYKIISIAYAVLHLLLFLFVAIVGFLPFGEETNYYQQFSGFFGPFLSAGHPYFILLLLLAACVISFWTVKRPEVSLVVTILSFSFFSIVLFSYSFEAALVAFLSRVGQVPVSSYGIGLDLIVAASYSLYLDFAFVVYTFVTLFIRYKNATKPWYRK